MAVASSLTAFAPSPVSVARAGRVAADGKFLRAGAERLLVKGVTYGTFAPDASGLQFPPAGQVEADFRAMAASGINTVRVYTAPPPQLLDLAAANGLRVMVGLPWAQHVAFLDDAAIAQDVRRSVVSSVRSLAGHPALLLFALGNEIPPSVVRWHGAARVEQFLNELLSDARGAAPDALFTYVNFPPTEFLDLTSFDVYAFNVYLHRERDLRAYLARLQTIAGEKPLILAEAGADSLREGQDGQARLTATHLQAAFAEGCAGAVAFAWTDEWWRGGQTVDDWKFGLVDEQRRPKPALHAVRRVFADAPFPQTVRETWPKVSVVVCAYNAASTIADCLESLQQLAYPDYEVIVVDDGSRDATAAIAKEFPCARVVRIPNGGLSAARNVGLREAAGEIVAYTDADVRADRDWLTYLVQPFLTSDVVGSGGPNVVPVDDPWMAQCVARAPGGPTHVLLDDRTAEHVPGCNMAFRRDALLAVNGFNATYIKAGDDVDLCWRLQARGWRIGFAPSALVWHHHRNTLRAYWRQQVGYGEGESWLMHDHPDKFAGRHMIWHGRIYSPLPFIRKLTSVKMNTGSWGLAAFPSVYHTASDPIRFLPQGVTWQVGSFAAVLGGIAALAFARDSAGLLLLIAGVLGIVTTLQRVVACAMATRLGPSLSGRRSAVVTRAMIAVLHLVQPWARFKGRLLGYLHPQEISTRELPPARRPWPTLRECAFTLPLLAGARAELRFWNERWHGVDDLLRRLTTSLRSARIGHRLDLDDGWQQTRDLSLALGRWASVDASALVEEHAGGRVLVRVRLGLRLSWLTIALTVAAFLAVMLALSHTISAAPRATAVSVALAVVCLAVILWRTAGAVAAVRRTVALTTEGLGAMALANGRTTMRFAPGIPPLLHAARGSLVTMLVAGPLLGSAMLMNEARLRVIRPPVGPPVASPRLAFHPPAWREPRVGLAVAPNGDLYLADAEADAIRRVTSSGAMTTVSTSAVLPATRPRTPQLQGALGVMPLRFDTPGGVAVSPRGDLYVADARGHRIYRIDRVTGATLVVAGTGLPGAEGDGGPALHARLDTPTAVAIDRRGNVLVADSGNHRIRRISLRSGRIETIAGGADRPASELGDGDDARDARLAWPSDLAVVPNGDIYIADTEHHRVRRIDATTGIITTIAGTGATGWSGDGGPAREASLSAPTGLAVVVRRSKTTVYIADSSNGRVRVVEPDGTISSLPFPPGIGLGEPARLAYHPRGWLYVSDAADRVAAVSITGARVTAPAIALRPVNLPQGM